MTDTTTTEAAQPDERVYVEALVDVAKKTLRVRELEAELDQARADRRAAMKIAVDRGASVYRIAKEAGTSHGSAWRMIHQSE